MTTHINNFVAVRKTRGDILSPAEYQSIVEAIQAIIKNYDFQSLTKDYKSFIDHINNFKDPHFDRNISFFDELVEKTHAIYVNMLPTPLNLADFKTQIVPTLKFIELIRRIVLNKYLYDQVKTPEGSVPSTANAYLSDDWMKGISKGIISLTFPESISTEEDFIRCGWNGNTSPIPVIFDAVDLIDHPEDLHSIFHTSSAVPLWSEGEFSTGYPFFLPIASNDFTVSLKIVGPPPGDCPIVSFQNGTDTVSIVYNADKTISVLLNGQTAIQSNVTSTDGRILIVIGRSRYISLEVCHKGVSSKKISLLALTNKAPFTNGMIKIGYENLFMSHFGLRDLTIRAGYKDTVPLDGLITPDGYYLLVDDDSTPVVDDDGSYLLDSN